MKRLLIILAIFCVFSGDAIAQIQQDVITDDPDGILRTTTLPICDASNVWTSYGIQIPNATGFPAQCINNHGVFELYPLGGGNLGFLWIVHDMGMGQASKGTMATSDATETYVYASGSSPDDDHPGVISLETRLTNNDSQWATIVGSGSTTSTGLASGTTGVPDLKCEIVFDIDNVTTDMLLTFGFTSDVDDPNDTHVAMFEYDTTSDTTFQAITRDGTGEAGQTETNTGVTPAIDTWYRAFIVWNGTDFKFYLAAGDADYTLQAIHTTDIPDADLTCGIYLQTLSASQKMVDIDYMRYSMLGLQR